MLIDTVVLGAYQTNCYLARPEGSREALVIDPGDDVPALRAALKTLGLTPAAVALTHGHFDHLLGAQALKAEFGAKIFISRADEAALSDPTVNCLPADAVTPFVPVSADGYLDAGPFSACGLDFTVVPTPGHTPGGVCLWAEKDDVLFTGDTLFLHGFGRTDLYGGSWGLLITSLRRLFAFPADPMVYPGHGGGARLTEIRKGYYR